MGTLLHILAQPLAADRLWPILLFLAALAIMGGLRALGVRIDAWHRTRHFVRGLRAKKEGPKLHGEQ